MDGTEEGWWPVHKTCKVGSQTKTGTTVGAVADESSRQMHRPRAR
jgi:hypothetical protein